MKRLEKAFLILAFVASMSGSAQADCAKACSEIQKARNFAHSAYQELEQAWSQTEDSARAAKLVVPMTKLSFLEGEIYATHQLECGPGSVCETLCDNQDLQVIMDGNKFNEGLKQIEANLRSIYAEITPDQSEYKPTVKQKMQLTIRNLKAAQGALKSAVDECKKNDKEFHKK